MESHRTLALARTWRRGSMRASRRRSSTDTPSQTLSGQYRVAN
jgi:hypothetical protein